MTPGTSIMFMRWVCLLQALGLLGFSQIGKKLQIPVEFGADDSEAAEEKSSLSLVESVRSKIMNFEVRCPIDFKAKEDPDGVHGVKVPHSQCVGHMRRVKSVAFATNGICTDSKCRSHNTIVIIDHLTLTDATNRPFL